MKRKIVFLALFLLMLSSADCFSQVAASPEPPSIKSYKGIPGKITKYNNFNYLDIIDETGEKNREAMGQYWEITYSYDSTFRQKRKFRDFVVNQIVEKKGSLFFEDTLQVHFVIPSDSGNVWGRLVLINDKVYRLRIIREAAFVSKIQFDTSPVAVYEKYVDSVALPPRINYMPKSVITRVQYSKYDHQEFSWNSKDTLFRQKVMGPYWDLRIDVRNSINKVDKEASSVEIFENYYRACVKAGGKILKSSPRELIFTLPLNKATQWCRVTVYLDGVYAVRVLIESDQDRTGPVEKVNTPVNPPESGPDKSGR